MIKISCQDKLLPGESQIEKYENAASIGFDGIEINARSVDELAGRVGDIKKAINKTGVKASTVCGGYRGWIGHFDSEMRIAAINDIKQLLKMMDDVGAESIIVPAAYGMFSKKLPPNIPPRKENEDKEILVESLSILGDEAAKYNCQIILEPLNRYEDHMVNTVLQAQEILELVNMSNVRTMIDFFHANIEETSISEAINKSIKYIGHVHLADSNRMQPGKGHIDFKQPLKVLNDLGYEGYCALECGITGDGTEALIKTLKILREF